MSKSLAKIESLTDYVQKIARKQEGLHQQITDLKTENELLKKQLSEANQEIENQKSQYKILSMAKSFTSDNDRTKARGRVNEFIREIDKCIALLNK